jgi:hypothetical protein
VLDYMRDLRDGTGAAVVFVHHTGHSGKRLRGSSDLEAYWESKLTLTREKSGTSRLAAEHREAESSPPFAYRLRTDSTGAVTLAPTGGDDHPDLNAQLLSRVASSPGISTRDVATGVGRRREAVGNALAELECRGTLYQQAVHYADRTGRPRERQGWYATPSAASPAVLEPGPARPAWDGDACAVRPPGGLMAPVGPGADADAGFLNSETRS